MIDEFAQRVLAMIEREREVGTLRGAHIAVDAERYKAIEKEAGRRGCDPLVWGIEVRRDSSFAEGEIQIRHA